MKREPKYFWEVISFLMQSVDKGVRKGQAKVLRKLLDKKRAVETDLRKMPFFLELEKQPIFLFYNPIWGIEMNSHVIINQLKLYALDAVFMEMYKKNRIPTFLGDDHLSYLRLIILLDKKKQKVSSKNGLKKSKAFGYIERHLTDFKCYLCRRKVESWKNFWREEIKRIMVKNKYIKGP